jgi:hypothetical protein
VKKTVDETYVYRQHGKTKDVRPLRWGMFNMATVVDGEILYPTSLLGKRVYLTREDMERLFKILARARKR